jgi:hypothetical protein
MVLFESEGDRRGFAAGATERWKFSISHFGDVDLPSARFDIELRGGGGAPRLSGTRWELGSIHRGALTDPIVVDATFPTVERPTRWTVTATLESAGSIVARNAWPIWVFPSSDLPMNRRLVRHASCKIPAEALGIGPLADGTGPADRGQNSVVIAQKFDESLLEHLQSGGRVLMLPSGESGSFAADDHWFLRCGPAALPGLTELTGRAPRTAASRVAAEFSVSDVRDLFVELQQFDWGGPVVSRVDGWMRRMDPMFVLWDNHDLPETRTHALLFAMPVGDGWLLATTLNLRTQSDNAETPWAARRWLLQRCLDWLCASRASDSDRGAENFAALSGELSRGELDLSKGPWRFAPDPGGKDLSRVAWAESDFDDSRWPTIGIDRSWEAQGYETLDGWAWYRRQVEIPDDLVDSKRLYLTFQGVDDHYRVYVNGHFVGTGGSIEDKASAFDERKSHDITALIGADRRCSIAIAVYDWFGAGGVFRPVFLGSKPATEATPMLK